MEVKKDKSADLERSTATRFLLALVLVLSVFFVAMEWNTTQTDDTPDFNKPDEMTQDLDMVPALTEQQMEQAAPAAASKHAATEKVHETNTEIKMQAVDRTVATVESEGNGENKPNDANKDKTDNLTPAQQEVAVDEDANKVKLRIVEQLPQFPGGPVEMMKWLTKNLIYPPEARAQQIQGDVMVSFIVGKDGTVSAITIVKKAHPLLNAEALRVIRKMPKWTPGTENGKPARAMIAIPISFQL